MSYAKAADLLRVAELAMSRFDGISLQDLTEEFGCDHRTAQRMMRAFEALFPRVEITEDDTRRRRWHMPRNDPRWLQAQGLGDSELVALDLAVKRAERDGAPTRPVTCVSCATGCWPPCRPALPAAPRPTPRRCSRRRDSPRVRARASAPASKRWAC